VLDIKLYIKPLTKDYSSSLQRILQIKPEDVVVTMTPVLKMKIIEDQIDIFIKNQFPEFYREQGEQFIEFVKEYYKWTQTF